MEMAFLKVATVAQLPPESVLEVMDMLQQNQVKKVGLLAKPRTP